MRRVLASLLVAFVAFVATPVAHAQQEGSNPDNSAIAVNRADGSNIFRLAFSIYRVVNSSQPAPSNAAIATASCEQCSTTAIAIQIVLLTAPETGSPTNAAVAVNENCTSCQTIALAYQLLFDVNSNVVLTPEGRKEIQDILAQIAALQNQNLSPDELKTQTDALVSQLATVIANELRPVGQQTNEQSSTNGTPPPGFTEPPTSEPTTSPADSSVPTDTPLATPTPTPVTTPAPTP